jgi:hypothetical protein
MLFKEIARFYSENHMKRTNKLCGKNAGLIHVKAGGKHNNHWALKIRPN